MICSARLKWDNLGWGDCRICKHSAAPHLSLPKQGLLPYFSVQVDTGASLHVCACCPFSVSLIASPSWPVTQLSRLSLNCNLKLPNQTKNTRKVGRPDRNSGYLQVLDLSQRRILISALHLMQHVEKKTSRNDGAGTLDSNLFSHVNWRLLDVRSRLWGRCVVSERVL